MRGPQLTTKWNSGGEREKLIFHIQHGSGNKLRHNFKTEHKKATRIQTTEFLEFKSFAY